MFFKCMGMERRVNSLEVVALFKLDAPQMVVEADIPKDVLMPLLTSFTS